VAAWPGAIGAITLVVEDLDACKDFYSRVFELPVVFEDDDSAAYAFGGTLVNLLVARAAGELIEPAVVGGPQDGPRLQLTLEVDDVDATCARLSALGVTLLNGPIDRPWGPRTATFRDPAGHVWEIAH
jgi:catechol 2,3-dioxygenase-like lactoylglutathione lyase family enzyme